jgi:hypothetical protein
MDIKQWFSESGSYSDGVELYKKLASCSRITLQSFEIENSANLLRLKYELKKALMSGSMATIPKTEKVVTAAKKTPEKEPFLKQIIKASAAVAFEKETMATYPMELHPIYRKRIEDFYLACELKFKLNMLPASAEGESLKIILQLEDLWTRIDKAWIILDHWKDHNRLMPIKESEDFSKLNGIQLVKMRSNLESSISKRQKTIEKMRVEADASPEDRALANLLLNKLEALHQLTLDLETIRNLLKNE